MDSVRAYPNVGPRALNTRIPWMAALVPTLSLGASDPGQSLSVEVGTAAELIAGDSMLAVLGVEGCEA